MFLSDSPAVIPYAILFTLLAHCSVRRRSPTSVRYVNGYHLKVTIYSKGNSARSKKGSCGRFWTLVLHFVPVVYNRCMDDGHIWPPHRGVINGEPVVQFIQPVCLRAYTCIGFIVQSISKKYLQGSSIRRAPGLVNFVPAVACHFCLNLPAAFS